ncbi:MULTISPECIES: MFS transporter [Methanobrevibacter]|uniref:POT family proton-dependent oligopeptide transporter n=1 Tax=Methanobrevibacter gottschalkii DSM 11977 TaxID=1122229 RepID=A0A3N5C654_9EURY|nr:MULTISPECIES: MFS transporter [Methanobrevibacter]OEC95757.1 hypothetical protein A9505_07375 [Methanobrevibacter sp. A27]RPF51871.1 POT family proton-dependent oligopeptide transporter [Methanobrevibacter gottschalkii DSM 11977]
MKYDKSLIVLFIIQICEGFSFYGLGAILTLFMTQFLNLSLSFAFLVYGTYFGLVYIATLFGGYLSDKYIRSRCLINAGIILMGLGFIVLSYFASWANPLVQTHSYFYFNTPEIMLIISLMSIILGEGLLRVNISSTVKQVYEDNEKKVESAFTLLIMALNIGAVSSAIILGLTIGEGNLSLYKYGFLILAVSLFIGIIIYNLFRNKYLVNSKGEIVGIKPSIKLESVMDNAEEKLTKQERNHVKAIIIILSISLIFFIGFEVIDSSLMFFAKDYVANTIPFVPFRISPEIIKFIEPFGVIIFSPFILTYFNLKDGDENESLIFRIMLGIIVLLVTYAVFFIPCMMVDNNMTDVSIIFIIIMELIRSTSEILILPIGLSIVSKLSPAKYLSRLLGLFYCSLAGAYVVSGYMAGFYPNAESMAHKLFGLIQINDFKIFASVFIVMYLTLFTATYISRNKIRDLME